MTCHLCRAVVQRLRASRTACAGAPTSDARMRRTVSPSSWPRHCWLSHRMRPALQLHPGTSVHDVAEASRAAMEAFLALDPHDTRGLSKWFAGPYRTAVSFAGLRMGSSGAHARAAQPRIPEIVSSAQETLRDAMHAAVKRGAEGLVAVLPAVVEVIPVRDVFGARGFAPMNPSCSRLAVRVLMLLVAHYLTRPDAYLLDAERYRAVG